MEKRSNSELEQLAVYQVSICVTTLKYLAYTDLKCRCVSNNPLYHKIGQDGQFEQSVAGRRLARPDLPATLIIGGAG